MMKVLAIFALLFLIGSGDAWRSDYVGRISPRANSDWGSWGRSEWCPGGHYAYGFRLKVESKQGHWIDDTAVNGILLHCKNGRGTIGNDITSSTMHWGNWGHSQYCPARTFLKAVSMRSESPQSGLVDDTAVNNLEFTCQTPAARKLTGYGLGWGTWTNRVTCPGKSVICGIQTKVESDQGLSTDDTALNGVRFYCCRH